MPSSCFVLHDWTQRKLRYVRSVVSAKQYDDNASVLFCCQIVNCFSGLRIVYDIEAQIGSRVKSVFTRCGNCSIPKYRPLVLDRNYTVVTTSFLMRGGDGYSVLAHRSRIINVLGMFCCNSVLSLSDDEKTITTGYFMNRS